uniref:Uncharacterized protein LOC111109209 n=1 Tax=Crassostrea virginica TaxID=6565 RepID=A0A8B8BDC6_CRAVI|nr:uncharacterized protein LOC111109209 [Crassostrea virginica]
MFPKVDLGVNYYQRQFELKFSGSLTSGYEVLFSAEGNTFAAAIHQCSKFCRSDIRCVGMELCRERDDLYRCRACCETITLKDQDLIYNDNNDCRYMEMHEDSETNIAVNKPATISSIYNRDHQHASYAVDNVTICLTGLFNAHTKSDFRPWIKLDLQDIYHKIVIFNRQDGYGSRLHDLQVNVGVNGTDNTCGFYKGPAKNGDRIIMFCTSLAHGSYVTLTILSLPGETDILHVCEIQIFVKN